MGVRLSARVTSSILIPVVIAALTGCSTRQTVYPGQFLGLENWKLSVPVIAPGGHAPTEIGEPELNTYQSDFFHLSADRKSAVFRTPVDGAVQPGSDFPRTELREVTDAGRAPAAWTNRQGNHSMTIRQTITATPALHPSLIAGQIHGATQYVVLVVLDGERLYVKAEDRMIGELDGGYRLGQLFTLRIEAAQGRIRIYYNDDLKVDYERICEACYFKAGCYLQANPQSRDDTEEGPDISRFDYGEVRIRDLAVEHTDVNRS